MNELTHKTAVFSGVFFTLALCMMLYLSMTKTIEISNVAQDEVSGLAGKVIDRTSQKTTDNEYTDAAEAVETVHQLSFDEDDKTDYLCIPLPEKIEADDISIENHYMDHRLYIVVSGGEADYYKTHSLNGNRVNIVDGTYEIDENEKLRLCLFMDGLYEYKTVLENGELYISFYSPREMYEHIVVIDPACGGADSGDTDGNVYEKDIALKTATYLKGLFDADTSGIKVYYTRMDDVNPTKEARVALANDTKADMYIRIETDFKEDTGIYGVTSYYNGDYFIPGFGNVELSDVLETQVATAIKGKALGLMDISREDYTLIHSTVPSTIIKVGCLSNHQEAALLARDEYIKNIAQGIYNAVKYVYDK